MKKARLVSLSIGVATVLLSLSLNSAVMATDDEPEGFEAEGDVPETGKPKKESRLSRLKGKARNAVTETSKTVSKEIGKSSVVKSGKEFAKSAGETVDTGIEFGAKAATIVPRAGIRAGRSIAKRISGKDKDKEQMELAENPAVEESTGETAEKGRLSRLKESAVGKAVSKEIDKSSVIQSGKEFAKSAGDTVDTGIEFGAKVATIVPRAGIRAGRSAAKGVAGKYEERAKKKEEAERRAKEDEAFIQKNREQELDRLVAARRKEEERAENERVEKLNKNPENQRFFAKIREQEYARMDKEDRLAEEKQRKLAEEQAAEEREKQRKLEKERQQAIETEKAKMRAEREERRRAREEARARRHEERAAKDQEEQLNREYEQEKRKLEEELRQAEEEERQHELSLKKPSLRRSKSKGAAESRLTTLEDIDAKVAKLDEDVQKGVISPKSAGEQLKALTAMKKNLSTQERRKSRGSGNPRSSVSNIPQVESPKAQEPTEPQGVPPSEEDAVQPESVRPRETEQQIKAKKAAVVGQLKGLGKNTQGILTPMEMRLEKEKLESEPTRGAQTEKQEVKESPPPSAEEMAELRKAAFNMMIGHNLKAPKRNQAFKLLDNNEPEDKVIEFLSKNTAKTPEEIKGEIEGQVQQQIKFKGGLFGSNVPQEETPPMEEPVRDDFKSRTLRQWKATHPDLSDKQIEEMYEEHLGWVENQ